MWSELIEIKNHFVAYIDILGFTDMVKNDFVKNPKHPKYIKILHHLFKDELEKMKQEYESIGFCQFSDSIVISAEYDMHRFKSFIDIVSKFQYKLLCEGILCRGGIAYGKHFHEESFMYSDGLIEAYITERDIAINPRIVISPDLFGLIYPSDDKVESNLSVLKDDDDLIFVDYLVNYNNNDYNKIINIINNRSSNPRVVSKYRWLVKYLTYKKIIVDTNLSHFKNVSKEP